LTDASPYRCEHAPADDGKNDARPVRPLILITIGACLVLVSCGPQTTWSAESRSPDGLWLATARSQQWSGPGNAYDGTTVYLKWTTRPPVEILEFSHQYATMNLKMEWAAPRHLNVIYGEKGPGDKVEIGFQAIRCADVEISVQHLNAAMTSDR
jgi:hypothetical protein